MIKNFKLKFISALIIAFGLGTQVSFYLVRLFLPISWIDMSTWNIRTALFNIGFGTSFILLFGMILGIICLCLEPTKEEKKK